MNLPSRTDPRLLDLIERYAKLEHAVPLSAWKTWADNIDVTKFRSEVGYMAQMWGGMNEERYLNSHKYVVQHAIDELFCITEDDAFGCVTFIEKCDADMQPDVISRDLIDNALRIAFLREALGWDYYDDLMVLDIGAGYGAFAHRLTDVYENAYVICVDGVPLSTYLCDYYLKYRSVERAESLPLDEIDKLRNEYIQTEPIQLACNMQSFTEMPLASINYWLDLCADLKVPHFFLEPHAGDLVHAHFYSSEPDGHTHYDYLPLFAQHGYKLVVRRFKFPEAESDKYIYNTEYLLWERK